MFKIGFIMITFVIAGSDACTTFGLKTEYFNKRLKGHTIWETTVVGHHECARECMSLTVCNSIDYYKRENTCKLNEVNSSSVDESEYVIQKGAIFSDIEDWPNTMFGPCGLRPCAENQRCLASSGTYLCKDIFSETNVAEGNPTSMSSVWKGNGGQKGVDGNTNQYLSKGFCFHSKTQKNPWWRVNLENIYGISRVRLFNRLDGASTKTRELNLTVGTTLQSMKSVGTSRDQIDDVHTFYFPTCIAGRYVQLTLMRKSNFFLCEVQVFAFPDKSSFCYARVNGKF